MCTVLALDLAIFLVLCLLVGLGCAVAGWIVGGCTVRAPGPDARAAGLVDAVPVPCQCPGGECREGVCYWPDPLGQVCEFDAWCEDPSRVCVQGRCTERACPVLAELCAPPGSSCAPGVRVCLRGVWGPCAGAVQPMPESGALACNGLDDDCDGVTDPPRAADYLDVVFALDVSGSMDRYLIPAKAAIETIAWALPGDTLFGLVEIEGRGPVVALDLEDFGDLRVALGEITTRGSDEPTIDTLSALGRGLVSWRPGSRRVVILLTDEAAQSYTTPAGTWGDACGDLTHGEAVTVFRLPAYAAGFAGCGAARDLTGDAGALAAAFMAAIADPCEGE